MENSQEIAIQEVKPINFDGSRNKIRGKLVVKSAHSKLGSRIGMAIVATAVCVIAAFGVVVPLAVRMPANKAELKSEKSRLAAQLAAIDGSFDYRKLAQIFYAIESLKGDIKNDICFALFSALSSCGVGIEGFRRIRRNRKDIYRLVASMPGSTYAFLRNNEKRADSLEARCNDFDNRLKAFIDGKDAFIDLEEQYENAMSQFVVERSVLDAEATEYLDGFREAVSLDRRRLKFVDDCSALADIRQQLDQGRDERTNVTTIHYMQDSASVALKYRLENEQGEIGMPERFLKLEQPLETRLLTA